MAVSMQAERQRPQSEKNVCEKIIIPANERMQQLDRVNQYAQNSWNVRVEDLNQRPYMQRNQVDIREVHDDSVSEECESMSVQDVSDPNE